MNLFLSEQNKISQSRQVISIITKNMQMKVMLQKLMAENQFLKNQKQQNHFVKFLPITQNRERQISYQKSTLQENIRNLEKKNKQLDYQILKMKQQHEILEEQYKKSQIKNRQLKSQLQKYKYSNKKQNSIQYENETLYYKHQQHVIQSKDTNNEYQRFAQFSIKKCQQYELLIIKLKKAISQQVSSFKNKIQIMMKDYQNINTKNKHIKNCQIQHQKLKIEVKKCQQLYFILKAQLGNDWNQWLETIRSFQFQNTYSRPSQTQRQLQYLKQIIKGVCYGLDKTESYIGKFKPQVSDLIAILRKIAQS